MRINSLDKAITDFDIRARRRDLLAGQLSGGNQQKLLLAKMMLLEPSIVIIDEPTRGIDIGTKEQIYQFIADLAKAGQIRHRHLLRECRNSSAYATASSSCARRASSAR